MKYRYLTIILFLLIISLNMFSQIEPGGNQAPGVGSSVPLDGGLLLGLLAGGSALSAYLFKRKKKEE